MTDEQPAVEVSGLVKRFGAARALDGVDLLIAPGTIYGLLGPNGAGKTTLVRILATLLAPSGGTARVFGHDVAAEPGAVRRRVALAGQAATVDDDLTGRENLVLVGWLAGLSRSAAKDRALALLTAFELEPSANRQVKTYSGGMRRRLDLAASTVVRADLYFLDEPTTGLDPASRTRVHALIRALAAGGATVLLTTQYLEEADQLASRIAVIDHGWVIAEGTPSGIKASAGAGTLRIRLVRQRQRAEAEKLLAQLLAPAHAGDDPLVLTVKVPATAADGQVTAALSGLAAAGIAVGAFSFGQPSLDEAFLTLTAPTATTRHDATEINS